MCNKSMRCRLWLGLVHSEADLEVGKWCRGSRPTRPSDVMLRPGEGSTVTLCEKKERDGNKEQEFKMSEN